MNAKNDNSDTTTLAISKQDRGYAKKKAKKHPKKPRRIHEAVCDPGNFDRVISEQFSRASLNCHKKVATVDETAPSSRSVAHQTSPHIIEQGILEVGDTAY